ncbi:MAG: hypothetical protein R3C28_13500 [Pirellulaceae bacterium]
MSFSLANEPFRVWHSRNGKRIKARLLRIEPQQAWLENQNGQSRPVPFSSFCAEDLEKLLAYSLASDLQARAAAQRQEPKESVRPDLATDGSDDEPELAAIGSLDDCLWLASSVQRVDTDCVYCEVLGGQLAAVPILDSLPEAESLRKLGHGDWIRVVGRITTDPKTSIRVPIVNKLGFETLYAYSQVQHVAERYSQAKDVMRLTSEVNRMRSELAESSDDTQQADVINTAESFTVTARTLQQTPAAPLKIMLAGQPVLVPPSWESEMRDVATGAIVDVELGFGNRTEESVNIVPLRQVQPSDSFVLLLKAIRTNEHRTVSARDEVLPNW